jgi:NhaA family Na+:H+ antiporter
VPPTSPSRLRLFARVASASERARLAAVLREETVGGALLVAAAAIALVWANSPWGDAYETVRETVVGPSSLHLDLTLGAWAADGLLAIFFFVAGLELKRELVAGDLRDPRRAALPIAAAVGGMVVPALLFVAVNRLAADGDTAGWAIPSATDIAFALAVLAVISRHLPVALRTFLLTLAVVDDLLAIIVIAVFYTSELDVLMLALALAPIAAFGALAQRRVRHWWLLVPLAVAAWALVHASGVHATVAGVLLAFTVPVLRSEAAGGPDAGPGLAEHLEHRLRPLSAGVAVPIFALLSAALAFGGLDGLVDALSDPVALGIIAGLALGKVVGIVAAAAAVARFTGAALDEALSWLDVVGLGLLGGVGFTVSLLIGELAYGADPLRSEAVKVGVLAGSLLAVAAATIVLRARDRVYRRLAAEHVAA